YRKRERKEVYLSVNIPSSSSDEREKTAEKLTSKVRELFPYADLRRLHTNGSATDAVFNISVRSAGELVELMDILKQNFKDGDFTFVDQPRLPGL
ncbi:MAG: hypothetical protein D6808_05950, partial [Candidatus Dadabacteria bacterium]